MDVIPSCLAATGHSVRMWNPVMHTPYAIGTFAHANDEADPAKYHDELIFARLRKMVVDVCKKCSGGAVGEAVVSAD